MDDFVPEEELPAELQQVIDDYRIELESEGFHTPDGAYNMCIQISAEFIGVLSEAGLPYGLEDFDPEIPEDCDDYPYDFGCCWSHWAVRSGDVVIDWTARQFDPEAPFPLVWRCPVRARRNEDAPQSQGEP